MFAIVVVSDLHLYTSLALKSQIRSPQMVLLLRSYAVAEGGLNTASRYSRCTLYMHKLLPSERHRRTSAQSSRYLRFLHDDAVQSPYPRCVGVGVGSPGHCVTM